MNLASINRRKYPHLYRAAVRGAAFTAKEWEGWGKVVQLRREGHEGAADRLIRRLLGVAEPMSEEAKEKLRAWREAHKDEIKEKAKAKRELRRRTLQAIKTGTAKLRRRTP